MLDLYLKLEDVTRHFVKPCIMDVKLGQRSYDPYASQEKREQQIRKYPLMEEIGFLVLGMRVSFGCCAIEKMWSELILLCVLCVTLITDLCEMIAIQISITVEIIILYGKSFTSRTENITRPVMNKMVLCRSFREYRGGAKVVLIFDNGRKCCTWCL